MGYIPYSAGGIVIQDIRMRDVISYFATYVFEKGADIPALLGAYILKVQKLVQQLLLYGLHITFYL